MWWCLLWTAVGLAGLLSFVCMIQHSILNQHEGRSWWGEWSDTPAMRELDRKWQLRFFGPLGVISYLFLAAVLLFLRAHGLLPGWAAYGGATLFVAFAIHTAVLTWRSRKRRE